MPQSNSPNKDATLKNFDGLEAWEWYEDGIRKLELTGKGVLTSYQTDAFKGEFVDEEHYAIIVKEDCDVYAPRAEDALSIFSDDLEDEERLLLSFRKGVVSKDLTEEARAALRGAATLTDNRGIAAGKVDRSKLRSIARDGEIVLIGNGVRARYRLPDGSLSATTAANKVLSGIAGNFDASARFPFCRQTGYSRNNMEKMEAAIPFLEAVSSCFRRQAPIHWGRQDQWMSESGIRENGWGLGATVFTTVTVNRNYRTAVHKDAGDYPRGYGNLSVIEGDPYEGGYTGFPKYRVAVDVRTGDFLAMNVHEWHGNTEMRPVNDPPEGEEWGDPLTQNAGFERLSIVCYARYGMRKCGPFEDEVQKRLAWKARFKSSKVLQAEKIVERAEGVLQANAEMEELVELVSED
jgi:hypothetical protein